MSNCPSSLEGLDTSWSLTLEVSGVGNICSFKNSKMIVGGRGGRKAMLITDPKKQKQKEAIIRCLELAFASKCLTGEGAISMGCSQRSSILLSLPEDDSRQWIPSVEISCEDVEDGEEGCSIVIERIN